MTTVPVMVGRRLKQEELYDTPGFDDTMGAQVDIANGVGLVNAGRGSRSVRPFVLNSHRSGDKMEGTRDVASTLVNMMTELEATFAAARMESQNVNAWMTSWTP
jgi:hypothetical protein